MFNPALTTCASERMKTFRFSFFPTFAARELMREAKPEKTQKSGVQPLFRHSPLLFVSQIGAGVALLPMPPAKADVFVVCAEHHLLALIGYASLAVKAGIAYRLAAAPANRLYLLYAVRPGEQPLAAFKKLSPEIGP